MVFRRLQNGSRSASGSSPGASRGAPGPGEAPGAPRRLPREASWGAHLGEKWPGNSSWALLEVTKVLFWAPEALQERSGSDFWSPGTCVCALLASSSFFERFEAPKMSPGRLPQPSKSRFSCGLFANLEIFAFSIPIAKRSTKMIPKWSPGGVRNFENQGFRVSCLQKLRFSLFRHRSPKGEPK